MSLLEDSSEGLSEAPAQLCAERLCLEQPESGEGHSCSFGGNWEHTSRWNSGSLSLWEASIDRS